MIEPSATFSAPSKIPDELGNKEQAGATRAPRRLSPKSILSILKMLLAVLPGAMGLTALGKLVLAHSRMSAPGAIATWGIVLILSFVGWGAAVNEIASPKRRLDFGLRAVLGAAINLFFGGLLALLTIVSKGAILGTALIGLGCHAFFEFRRRREVMRSWAGASRLVRDAPLF